MSHWIRALAIGTALAAAGTAACAAEATSAPSREEFTALKAEVEALRALLPTQAHTMVDVEHQFANLWFAAREKNWSLAAFYLNETRGRVAWTMRIRPVRKLANGDDIVLAPMAQALEDGGFAPLRAALDRHDSKAFEAAYRATLTACHACHVAIEKPALKPDIPRIPGALLIRMKPDRVD
jgi:cytochrome c553